MLGMGSNPNPPMSAIPNSPTSTIKLVFIHHSVGSDWLKPDSGNLRQALNQNNYYVTESDYGWGPDSIGDLTDMGHWYNWFLGPQRDTYLQALYTNDFVSDTIGENTIPDPGGENRIILFKSCFISGDIIYGNPDDPPLPEGTVNPLYGKDQSEDTYYTVANIKGLYRDLLKYFATRQDKLFILITTPPSISQATTPADAANLRAINTWLVRDWLANYPYKNVAVFDYYNILTSNGGDANTNDLGAQTGSHHRYRNGQVEHLIGGSNFLAYPSGPDDSHPTAAGHQKATGEFIPLLNIIVNCWQNKGDCPALAGGVTTASPNPPSGAEAPF